jgi:hypothetical protein
MKVLHELIQSLAILLLASTIGLYATTTFVSESGHWKTGHLEVATLQIIQDYRL